VLYVMELLGIVLIWLGYRSNVGPAASEKALAVASA
jgi:hypothetical protein